MKKEPNIDFKIINCNNETVFEGTTNEDGIVETTLPYGKYIIKQMSTTEGYEYAEGK